MREADARPWARWLALSLAIVVADLATKAWVTRAFTLGEVHEVTPFFNLVLVHNTGAAFSFLAGAGGWQRWFFMFVTAVVSIAILWMLRRHHGQRLLAAALALVLGGALGNLWDRMIAGHVVDFLDFNIGTYHWPSFNVADSAIVIGAILLVADILFSKSPEQERAR